MTTKDQRPATGKATKCRACGGKGSISKDGKKQVRCITCRGTGQSSGSYQTK